MGFFLSPWKTRGVILGSCKEYSGLIETQYLVWKGHFPFTTLYLAFSDCKCIIKYTKITQLNQTSLYSMQPFLYVIFFLSRILIWQTCKLNVIFCFLQFVYINSRGMMILFAISACGQIDIHTMWSENSHWLTASYCKFLWPDALDHRNNHGQPV